MAFTAGEEAVFQSGGVGAWTSFQREEEPTVCVLGEWGPWLYNQLLFEPSCRIY